MRRLTGRAPTSMTGPTHGGDDTSSRRLYKIRFLGPMLPSTPAPAGDSHAPCMYRFTPPAPRKAHQAPPLFLADWAGSAYLNFILPFPPIIATVCCARRGDNPVGKSQPP
jgi:hypothetical protein